jgi:RNA polymerase sigma-70 factor (ECF subfamily)
VAGGGSATHATIFAALDAASLGRMRRVALRITHDASAADDVVQGAFEKALRHAASFRREARPTTWLHRIVVNEALMWHRSEARRRAQRARAAVGGDLAEADPGAEPLEALLARERREQLGRAIAALRPEDADLLVRCALGETDYAAWARDHRLRPSAAKTRAFRARLALRAALEADQQQPSSQGPRVSR